MRPVNEPTERVIRRRRVWLFRLAAIALGLVPLLLLEVLFALLGWGRPDYRVDPFVGFRGSRPLFELNAEQDRYEIPPARRVFFRPESFSASKSSDEFRIFCLGGSTVQGRPYAIETSFTTWLELSLQAADPNHRWQVVNCGGISYASYRLAPILEEVLNYRPNLIILYTGHNEFLEDRTYEAIKKRPRAVTSALQLASKSRTYNLIQVAYQRAWGAPPMPNDRPLLAEDVQALLDYQGGLEKYRPDPVWREGIAQHFRFNLRRMVELSRAASVPIWFVDPVCNLRDSPPFKAAHRSDLSPDQLLRWNQLREQASRCFASEPQRAVRLLEEAARIDSHHAGLQYDLAKSYETRGDIEGARRAYLRANDLDVCPLRIIQPLRDALLQVARQTGTPVIPVREFFRRNCRQGIPGGYLLVDHVHPSISGHQMIAQLLLDQMAQQQLVSLEPDWQPRRDALYQQHLDSLDDKYYMQGQRRLQGLRSWAQGRATRLPGSSDDPPRPVE